MYQTCPKSLTNLKKSLEKGRMAEIQVPQNSKPIQDSAILQFCRIKTQTQQRKGKKKKKKMRLEEAWSRAGPDSGSGEKE